MNALLRLLNRGADHAFETEDGDPRPLRAVVALVACAMLMLELLLARLFPFLLGNISAFLAIPVAMFGLSLGALVLHLSPRRPGGRWLPLLVPLVLLATLGSFSWCFYLFNEVFGLTHHKLQNPATDAWKIVGLSTAFLPAFALAGITLSTAFTQGVKDLGRLYGLDLFGSAFACLLTPILLSQLDLPLVICALISLLAVAQVALFVRWRRALGVSITLFVLGLCFFGAQQKIFTEHPDPAILGVRYARGRQVEELRHRWNDVSRVAVLRFFYEGKRAGSGFRVIHDDGISNVRVRRYDPKKVAAGGRVKTTQGLAFLLDPKPKNALVIFAGAGQDMVQMLEYARGDLDITGIELNGLVPWIVSDNGWDQWNLRAFYALPNVDLRADEGRSFLNGDDTIYDTIFVASNGAQQASRTGHSRKFLDTYEAMEAYLEHLAPGGLIVFNEQPYTNKLESWKRILTARGQQPADAIMVLGLGKRPGRRVDTLVVKPSGFSAGEVQRIRTRWNGKGGRHMHYGPGVPGHRRIVELVKRPPRFDQQVATDDRPFVRRIHYESFRLKPATEDIRRIAYALDWIKIFTVLLFGGLSILVWTAFQLRSKQGRRLPPWLSLYFVGTGICYMLTQIGLMAKLELFLGKPILSIAVVLAAFLLANGAGSTWVGRRERDGRPVSPMLPAAAAALLVPLTLLLIEGLLLKLLGLPIPIKALIALIAVSPLAFVLGMFYPVGVRLTAERGLSALVPMTFGLATLSSVLGSTWAMVAVINLGFRAVVLLSVPGYLLLLLLGFLATGRRGSPSRQAPIR